jgi:glutamyl-tRNA reductase
MPSNNIAVSFIGSGNVACQLAPALKKSGYTIEKIIARNPKTGKSLAKKVGATYTNDFSKIEDTIKYYNYRCK